MSSSPSKRPKASKTGKAVFQSQRHHGPADTAKPEPGTRRKAAPAGKTPKAQETKRSGPPNQPATPPIPAQEPSASRGTLYLIPNTLDLGHQPPLTSSPTTAAGGGVDIGQVSHDSLLASLPASCVQLAAKLSFWIVENAKSARAFLKRVDGLMALQQPLQSLAMQEIPPPQKGGSTSSAPTPDLQAWLQPALDGHDMGLLSEAGLPGVADPGAQVVRCAHQMGIRVVPIAGPSAITLALAASGLQGQSFAFVGYLPTDLLQRAQRIQELEKASRKSNQSQIAIETPYRNEVFWQALLTHLQPETWLSVSCGLTLPAGLSRTQTVAYWRQHPLSLPKDMPAVFIWLSC